MPRAAIVDQLQVVNVKSDLTLKGLELVRLVFSLDRFQELHQLPARLPNLKRLRSISLEIIFSRLGYEARRIHLGRYVQPAAARVAFFTIKQLTLFAE